MMSPTLKTAQLSSGVAQSATSSPANTTLPEVVERALARSGMSYSTFVRCITQNAFRSLVSWSEADMERLLLTCEALGLSPVGRDLYAIQPSSGAGVLIAVGVDGWSRILNQHPQFDGMEFEESEDLVGGVPSWVRCTIHRRDRRVAMSIKEYLCEAVRDTGAWQTHPRRMLRHKAMVQCARLAFELPTSSGIYDPDEAERVGLTSGDNLQKNDQKNDEAGLRKHDGTVDAVGVMASSKASKTSEDAGAANGNRAANEYGSTTSLHTSQLAPKPMTQPVIQVSAPKLRRGPSSTLQIIDTLTKQKSHDSSP